MFLKRYLFMSVIHLFISAFLICSMLLSAPINTAPLNNNIKGLRLEQENGRKVDFSNLKLPAVVAFFAPVLESSSQIVALNRILKQKNYRKFKFYAISRGLNNEEKNGAIDYLKSEKINATLLFDPEMIAAKWFNVSAVPTFFIVDRAGNVATIGINNVNNSIRKRSFEDFLDLVLKNQEIPFIDFIPWNKTYAKAMALIGKPAPKVSLINLDGNKQNIETRKRNNIVLVFWSPGCPHCLSELPRINSFYIKYGKSYDFDVLAIVRANNEEIKTKIKNIANDKNISFPILIDDKGTTMDDYGASAVPMAFFVNSENQVVDVLIGENEPFEPIYHSIFTDKRRLAIGE